MFNNIRGVLGNKCAGQHNLKTVHFRETLASDNFLAWSSAIRVFFFSALSTLGRASFYGMMVGVTPYTSPSWRCPGSTSSLPALISFLGGVKRPLVWNMQKTELGEHFDAFFHSHFLKIEAAMVFWALARQKTSSVQTRLGQKPL